MIPANRSAFQVVGDAVMDFVTAWLAESSLKIWIRIWLCFLLAGCMAPLAFLPHPFAITNLVAMIPILVFNGRELARVRGLNKNMGWPHIVGWVPVLFVNVLALTTDRIGGELMSWENANGNAYQQARVVVVWANSVILGISCAFDAVDTYLYYVKGETTIERSKWTTDQLTPAAVATNNCCHNEQEDYC